MYQVRRITQNARGEITMLVTRGLTKREAVRLLPDQGTILKDTIDGVRTYSYVVSR